MSQLPRLLERLHALVPYLARVLPGALHAGHDGHRGVRRLVGVEVGEEGEHGEVARDGEDVDRRGRLLADVDFLVDEVVAYGEGLRMRVSQ